MSLTESSPSPSPNLATPAVPKIVVSARTQRPTRRWPWATVALLVVAPAAYYLMTGGASRYWKPRGPVFRLATVDRGDVALYVVEGGSMESANNATVKCRVEAILGLVGGTQGQNGQGKGGMNNKNAQQGAQAQQGQQQQQQQQPAAKKGGAGGAVASKGVSGKGSSNIAGAANAGGMAAAAPAAGGAGGAGAPSTGSTTVQKPTIQSFSYAVQPHVPLRPATPANQQQASKKNAQMPMPGGGGGGGMGNQEKAGSTRIIWILPEGTEVKKDDKVCELDSAAFRDELLAQLIRWDQAKAWVIQAESILKVAEIAVDEYEKGILPKDRLSLAGYIKACQNDVEQAKASLDYSTEIYRKGLKTRQQYEGDRFALDRAKISLGEALGMQDRLEKYTAPKIKINLLAKVDAVRADVEAQKAAFQLEDVRKKKLETMIERCTLRAPSDGIVVYAKPANGWGQVQALIQEGTTVREGQEIFQIPDPNNMRVRVKVNETKVALIHSGQRARVLVDAYPEHPFSGVVDQVTAIPAPAQGPISDVKVYNAVVNIDSRGFSGLRPGLSAEVSFDIDTRRDVPRVPVSAVRWADDRAYVAVPAPGQGYTWKAIQIGLTNEVYAEVASGLAPGDQVVANPEGLTPPRRRKEGTVAAAPAAPQG